jgi:subtilisin family serine protease
VFVVAAGNDDMNASGFQPANVADVITVSALADFNGLPGGGAASTCRADVDDTLADFSNWGSTVEIAAPGVCIYSTWKGGGYNTISGTSMASPHVAGAAALLASRNNPANRTDVLNISNTLRSTGNTNWTDDSGDGVKEPLLDVSNSSTYNPLWVP